MPPSRSRPMKLTPLLLVLAATALSTPSALSQTASNPAAKPAAKPAPKPAPKPAARPAAKAPAAAATEKTATIGGGANAASAKNNIVTVKAALQKSLYGGKIIAQIMRPGQGQSPLG